MAISSVEHRDNRRVSFPAHSNASRLDVDAIYFRPIDILSPTLSVNSIDGLPSPVSPVSAFDLPFSSAFSSTLSTRRPGNTFVHESPFNLCDLPGQRPVPALQIPTTQSDKLNDTRRIVDVTLDSPVEIELSVSSSKVSSTTARPALEALDLARPKSVHVRQRQQQKQPAVPLSDMTEHPDQVKGPLDLIEPNVRFTQIFAPQTIVAQPLPGSPGDDILSKEVWIDSSTGKQLLVRSRQSLRARAGTVAKLVQRCLSKVRGCLSAQPRRHSIELGDLEEGRPEQQQLENILQTIDDEVVKNGGVAFPHDQTAESKAATMHLATLGIDRSKDSVKPPWWRNASGQVPLHIELCRCSCTWCEAFHNGGVSSSTMSIIAGKTSHETSPESCCTRACKDAQAAFWRAEAEKWTQEVLEERKNHKWEVRWNKISVNGKNIGTWVAVQPAEMWAWLGQRRLLSWGLMLLIVALLIVGTILAVSAMPH